MSKKTSKYKVLNRDDINKKILARSPPERSPDELLGPNGRYRDENQKLYKLKEQQFLNAAKQYNKMNVETSCIRRERLHSDYEAGIDYSFKETPEEESKTEEASSEGLLLRKRTVRKAHTTPDHDKEPCCVEPWFRRYLILNKFISASRGVILRNRLLKNLEILKKLTPEDIKKYEVNHNRCYNVSYAEIFAKFIR